MIARAKIASATLVMAAATFLSRIAGLVRDVVIARLFGAGLVTDAFFMAFTIPNMLRRFFGEGSLTAAFVPVFSEVFYQRGEQEAQRLANRCVTLLLLVMLAVVSVGILFSPWIVEGIGYGFKHVPGKLALTDHLNRLMFPYIGLVSLLALVTGILNVRGHFFLPSLSPLFLNLTMIISSLTLGQLFAQPVFALALGVLLGGIVQLLLQIPALTRYGIRLRLDFTFIGDEKLKQNALLMLPGIAGVAIYQINIVVTRLLASFLPDGAVSYLYYGQRLFEFPQGILVVSLAQAVLPMMSRQVAADDLSGLRQSLSFALAMITLFMLPAVIGLILCAEPIYALFFRGGEFNLIAVQKTALALICYAPGLIFVGYSRIAAQTFYALKDTRTPVLVSGATLLINLLAGLLLMQPYGYVGLALALTLASIFNSVLLLILLQRRTGRFLHSGFWLPLIKALPACLVMGLGVFFLLQQVDWLQPGQFALKAGLLLGAILFGGGAYLGSCYLLRVSEVREGLAFLLKRRKS